MTAVDIRVSREDAPVHAFLLCALVSCRALLPVTGASRRVLPQCIRVSFDEMQLSKHRRARLSPFFICLSLTGPGAHEKMQL